MEYFLAFGFIVWVCVYIFKQSRTREPKSNNHNIDEDMVFEAIDTEDEKKNLTLESKHV